MQHGSPGQSQEPERLGSLVCRQPAPAQACQPGHCWLVTSTLYFTFYFILWFNPLPPPPPSLCFDSMVCHQPAPVQACPSALLKHCCPVTLSYLHPVLCFKTPLPPGAPIKATVSIWSVLVSDVHSLILKHALPKPSCHSPFPLFPACTPMDRA